MITLVLALVGGGSLTLLQKGCSTTNETIEIANVGVDNLKRGIEDAEKALKISQLNKDEDIKIKQEINEIKIRLTNIEEDIARGEKELNEIKKELKDLVNRVIELLIKLS